MLFYIPKINYLNISIETYRNSKKIFNRMKRRGWGKYYKFKFKIVIPWNYFKPSEKHFIPSTPIELRLFRIIIILKITLNNYNKI